MGEKAAAAAAKKPKAGTWKHALQTHKWLYIMIAPGVIWMLVFCFLPMFGLLMAFEDFSPYNGIPCWGRFFTAPS